MARVKIPEELKKAISTLTFKDKDKLLFRLIAKDPSLVEKLNFELVQKEEGITSRDRREELKREIVAYLEKSVPHYYSPGYVLLDLRHLSGAITRHVKTTNDKYGDVYLNFVMLNHCLRLLGTNIQQAIPQKAFTFNTYIVKRALRLQQQLSKMHEDHVLDFEEPMKELGQRIASIPSTMKMANIHLLDVNYLLKGELPK